MMTTRPLPRSSHSARSERGDAGLPILLITPLLLLVVLHLINATQQLYERREAYAVAAAAGRVANQADPTQVRINETVAVDLTKSAEAVERFVSDAGYRVVELDYTDNADGTVDVAIVIEGDVDYLFSLPSLLPTTITGRAETVLIAGVNEGGG